MPGSNEKVVVQRKEPRSTVVPNIVFAICMMAFIVFIFWQYAMSGKPWLGVTQNARDPAAVTTPGPTPN
jgi:hypothetical protein